MRKQLLSVLPLLMLAFVMAAAETQSTGTEPVPHAALQQVNVVRGNNGIRRWRSSARGEAEAPSEHAGNPGTRGAWTCPTRPASSRNDIPWAATGQSVRVRHYAQSAKPPGRGRPPEARHHQAGAQQRQQHRLERCAPPGSAKIAFGGQARRKGAARTSPAAPGAKARFERAVRRAEQQQPLHNKLFLRQLGHGIRLRRSLSTRRRTMFCFLRDSSSFATPTWSLASKNAAARFGQPGSFFDPLIPSQPWSCS